MKQTKTTLMMISVLIMLSIWGFIAVYKAGFIPSGLDLFIFALIIICGIYAFVIHLRRHRDHEQGIPVEDEMSTRIKHKTGYHAFTASMYMWLLIFVFKDLFPDVETMLGGGILLSGVIFMGIKGYLAKHYNEDQA